jgi:antitoxin component of RelBE/YafQ-DinJ toxin-antitoxin module
MVTVKINEKTKDGKALLEFLKAFTAKSKGVEIVENAQIETHTKPAAVSENIPNEETVRIFKENDKKGVKGLKKYKNVEELFEDLTLNKLQNIKDSNSTLSLQELSQASLGELWENEDDLWNNFYSESLK